MSQTLNLKRSSRLQSGEHVTAFPLELTSAYAEGLLKAGLPEE
jgi:hypothetical protein